MVGHKSTSGGGDFAGFEKAAGTNVPLSNMIGKTSFTISDGLANKLSQVTGRKGEETKRALLHGIAFKSASMATDTQAKVDAVYADPGAAPAPEQQQQQQAHVNHVKAHNERTAKLGGMTGPNMDRA